MHGAAFQAPRLRKLRGTVGTDALRLKEIERLAHFPHFHRSPIGGDALQAGQATPCRRGNLAKRKSCCACLNPLQQFISMKAAMAAYQIDRVQMQGR